MREWISYNNIVDLLYGNKFSMIGDSYTLKDEAEDAGITYV